jgi:exopolyphosphatase/pppGpp-phosphohydrolase
MKNEKEPFAIKITPADEERLQAVIRLAQTCNYEADHTHQVTRLALRLFDELTNIHKLGLRERFWLQSAAILHDIGWIEGWKSHHKVSLRIILTASILPFDSKERLIIGSIARYHRKALPDISHDHFAALTPEEQQSVRLLSALLRVADGLDRTHQNRVRDVKCRVTSKQITLVCSVQQESDDENKLILEKGDLFEIVFQRKLVLAWKKVS